MSEYCQKSFSGGMNFLLDDTRLQDNQYRLGFNLRNRYDVLDQVRKSKIDVSFPTGVVQEVVTFGIYIIAFISGAAWYRRYDLLGWIQIPAFSMNPSVPRYWTVAVPVATTLYGRYSTQTSTITNSSAPVISVNSVAAAAAGNLPGLLVQDNVSQPMFIYLDAKGIIQCRTTKTYAEWNATYVANVLTDDQREYVPIGNTMAWCDGLLYIASQDGNTIYRSVSGRPLDFVVNVATDGSKGGDATTTSYSVGVGGISCLRAMQDGSLFVAASNSNFLVSKNMTQNAITLWGEYTFIRKYLFEATCISDRCIIDSLGDTRFIDLTGVRSFNSILQLQNEGRNSPFTANIARAFAGITQDTAASILFNNYEFYAMNTVFGPAIAVYDTISGGWSSFDTVQSAAKIKQLVKIELGIQRLYAITEDNKLLELYSDSEDFAVATVITKGITSTLAAPQGLSQARFEVKLSDVRIILDKITQNTTVTTTAIINNRVSRPLNAVPKVITYVPPPVTYSRTLPIPDVNSQLGNVYIPVPDAEQGWKLSLLISWDAGASIVLFSTQLKDETPMNPIQSMGTIK